MSGPGSSCDLARGATRGIEDSTLSELCEPQVPSGTSNGHAWPSFAGSLPSALAHLRNRPKPTVREWRPSWCTRSGEPLQCKDDFSSCTQRIQTHIMIAPQAELGRRRVVGKRGYARRPMVGGRVTQGGWIARTSSSGLPRFTPGRSNPNCCRRSREGSTCCSPEVSSTSSAQ